MQQVRSGYSEHQAQISDESSDEMLAAFDRCRQDWGVQWNMVAFCASQQLSGRAKLPDVISDLPDDVQSTIVTGCGRDWQEDFAMMAFCAEQQSGAWRRIND